MLWDTMYIFQTCVRCLIKMCGFLGIYSNALACRRSWSKQITSCKTQQTKFIAHTYTHTASSTIAWGQALSNPFLSPSQQSVLPVATHVDTEASGVAHKWTPTPSLWTLLSQNPPKYMWGGGEERIRGTGESAACWNERHVRIGMAEL